MAHLKSKRAEKDSLGSIKIPKDALYGAGTGRALENFQVSRVPMPLAIIHAMAAIKANAAEVNESLGLLPSKLAKHIAKACREIESGKWDSQFPLDVFQTGSGTSSNMNVNEVAANLANVALGSKIGANTPIHPNDHVNMGQSSNDVFPSAIQIAVVRGIYDLLLPSLRELRDALNAKSREFSEIIKVGRTHLQDATPLTLGQVFGGYATQISKALDRLSGVLPRLLELPLGGTAVGTGINTHPRFAKAVSQKLSREYRLNFVEATNHFEAQASRDACVELSGVLKVVAVSSFKMANDIRWLGSGPRAGLGELILPAVQPGSSIMPGKVNPVMIESLLQVCVEVMGLDAATTFAGASGNFELNTMMPIMGLNLLQSIEWMSNSINGFTKVVRGLKPDRERIQKNVEMSLMNVTALVPEIGYDKASEIAKKAHAEGKSIREVAAECLEIPKSKLDRLLDLKRLV